MDRIKVDEILENAEKDIEAADSTDSINDIRNKYLAKKSELMALMSTLGSLSPDERKSFGQKLNEVRNRIASKIQERSDALAQKALEAKLKELKRLLPDSAKDSPISSSEFNTLVRIGKALRAQIASVRKYKKSPIHRSGCIRLVAKKNFI